MVAVLFTVMQNMHIRKWAVRWIHIRARLQSGYMYLNKSSPICIMFQPRRHENRQVIQNLSEYGTRLFLAMISWKNSRKEVGFISG